MTFTLKHIILLFWLLFVGNNCIIANKKASPIHRDASVENTWEITINYPLIPQNSVRVPSRFDFEIFDNQKHLVYYNISIDSINSVLNAIISTSTIESIVKLTYLNRDHLKTMVVKNHVDTLLRDTFSEEVILYFYHEQMAQYAILHDLPRVKHLFYVETSGGINNIRHIRGQIEQVLTDNEEVLIYFNAPGTPMVVSSREELPRFYNLLLTTQTMPPFAPDEFKKLTGITDTYFSGQKADTELIMHFYISEVNVNSLTDYLLKPLYGKLLRDDYRKISIALYTDFDPKNKVPDFDYINLLKLLE